MRLFAAFIVMLFLTACAAGPSGSATVPENLLQKCVPLMPVTGFDGKTAQAWMTMAALSYDSCMKRQGRLVDAVRAGNPKGVAGKEPTGAVNSPE